MPDPVDALIRDLLTSLRQQESPYRDVMDAWRTSCPRLPVWEEAHDRGLVERRFIDGQSMIAITQAGLGFLAG